MNSLVYHFTMTNTAESRNFSVELISIAEDVRITTEEMFEDEETTRSTLLFFHVKNTSDESVSWWYNENNFIGSDGFQYKSGENIYETVGNGHEVLPPHWYPNPTIQPGRKARCVTEIPEFPDDVSVEEAIYNYNEDYYEIEIDTSQLEEAPI